MGCAKKLVFSWGGNPGVGSLHRLRDAVEHGWPVPLEIEEHSHAGMATAYAAGAANLPFGVLRGYGGTATSRPTRGSAKVMLPVHGRGARSGSRAPAGRRASSTPRGPTGMGTSSSGGSSASRRRPSSPRTRSIVTVEEIVDELEPRPGATVIPGWVVGAVSLVPRGAHPSYAANYYDRDNEFYVAWDPISRDRDKFATWMERHVLAA